MKKSGSNGRLSLVLMAMLPLVVVMLGPIEPAAAAGGSQRWYLSNRWGDTVDSVCSYAEPGDTVLAGDWNGDGIDTPGIWKNGIFVFSNSCGGTGNYRVTFGNWDDVPVVGDWDGDGTDTPGVFRNGMWYLSNGFGGQVSHAFAYGAPGDIPVVGDWDGDGRDTVGIVRNAEWHLSNSLGGAVNYSFHFGVSGDRPVVGDWDANGSDTPGVRQSGAHWALSNVFGGTGNYFFTYGETSDAPLTGDWNGDGNDTPGVSRYLPTSCPGELEHPRYTDVRQYLNQQVAAGQLSQAQADAYACYPELIVDSANASTSMTAGQGSVVPKAATCAGGGDYKKSMGFLFPLKNLFGGTLGNAEVTLAWCYNGTKVSRSNPRCTVSVTKWGTVNGVTGGSCNPNDLEPVPYGGIYPGQYNYYAKPVWTFPLNWPAPTQVSVGGVYIYARSDGSCYHRWDYKGAQNESGPFC